MADLGDGPVRSADIATRTEDSVDGKEGFVGLCLQTGTAFAAAARPVAQAIDAERLAELRAMPYRQYLRTPEWKRTRAAALLRAGNACSLDVTHTENLEVHHRTYERLGAELMSDLTVLCHACHQLYHGENGRPRRKQSAKLAKSRKPSLLRRLLAS